MIIDSHVHVGWYINGYHSPLAVWGSLYKAGVSKICVSSTSICAELYNNVRTEFYQLIALAGRDNIKPILWVSPKMILKRWPLLEFLKNKIEWKAIKIHYVSHPQFQNSTLLINSFISLSRHLGNIPIMFHTGNWESCHAGSFELMIRDNQDLIFVLAHGRPIAETIFLMKRYHNVWTDTAFMPVEDIKTLKEERLTSRTMFGSDAPINRIYYPDLSTEEYLKARIAEVNEIAPEILSNCVYDK